MINTTRRRFLQQSAASCIAAPFLGSLAMLPKMSQAQSNDYKALVCLFLFGGNDHNNTIIPYDEPSYSLYHQIRSGGAAYPNEGGIALGRSSLTSTRLTPTVALPNQKEFALHPNLTGLTSLFHQGVCAPLLNVGPLNVPMTRTQYNSQNRTLYPLPPKLFSHNDQQSIWQSSSPEGSTVGWGGNLGDYMLMDNANDVFTCISVSGNNVFLSGDRTVNYNVSTSGPVAIVPTKANPWGSEATKNTLNQILKQSPKTNPMYELLTQIQARSIDSETLLSSAISTVQLNTSFDNESLSNQLKTVAKIIARSSTLGMKRQVFFVSLGGFDLHDHLMTKHGPLLTKVDRAISSFYNATVELGLDQNTTLFTASEFGRTLSSNGDGSDHGWGGHSFIIGGAVNGGRFFGTIPSIDIGSTEQDHVGQGRLIPTTSLDQFAATLALWFGVDQDSLPQILPNLNQFGRSMYGIDYSINLGFLR